ncbi:MAG: hypothetical protein ABSD49_03370 [Candidatus Bathyarchaeia archaeon]|jgi:hypothetical protein
MVTEQVNWRELFTVEQVEKPFHIETEAGECSGNCLEAKEIKCICRCRQLLRKGERLGGD